MILRKLGNKRKIALDIQKHFPFHNMFIETFFGAGGMFFYKAKAKYNIVNDLDSDVFNLFKVVTTRKEELKKAFFQMPIHSDLLEHWINNNETDEIQKAIRFLFISNFTFLGTGEAIKYGNENPKNKMYHYIDKTFDLIHDVQFMNKDFRIFLNSIQIREPEKTFIYNDPPYLNKVNNYSHSFTEADSNDLFDQLENTGCKWAMSEFNHPFILKQVNSRHLNLITIGERQNIKNRETEILITNYKNDPTLFDTH
jgi:DNA adenine methylase